MKFADNLQNMVLISFVVHIMVIGISSFALKRHHPFYVPNAYNVKIITPTVKRASVTKTAPKKPVDVKKAAPQKKAAEKKVPPTLTKEKIRMIDEKIERIKSKKKNEKIDELESMIDSSVMKVKAKEVEQDHSGEGAVEAEVQSGEGGGILPKYISDIAQQIRKEWVYPDFMNNDLVTVVAVRIERTGNIKVIGVEESSGNALFDKSVLRAINKASPVSRPPYEMEIGLRFHP